MLEFIERNKRLLLSYRVVLWILGWILLCMGAIGFAMLLSEYFQSTGTVTFHGTYGMFKRSYSHFISIGLISLGLAQLVRYLCDNKMGLLLRYGDKILYLYAAIAVWQDIVNDWLNMTGRMGGDIASQRHWFLFTFPVTLIYRIAEVLILIGLGIFLKKFIAVIEDSRPKEKQDQVQA